jgi:hypothetical protein
MHRSLLALPLCALLTACTGTVAVETTQAAARPLDPRRAAFGEDDGNVPGAAATKVISQKDDGNYGGAAASDTLQQKDDVQEPIRPPRFQ